MIASAPGKIVLWGEYAVLAGAPAAVMAVNRRAEIAIMSSQAWQFASSGLKAPGLYCGSGNFTGAVTAATAEAVLAHLGFDQFPQPAYQLHTTTDAFYSPTGKLGLGSSAAVCSATTLALGRLHDRAMAWTDALAVHHKLQGGGSGLDVASSWHGGVIRFTRDPKPQVSAFELPENLSWQVVFTGKPAVTARHVAEFSSWRAQADVTPLTWLAEAARNLFEVPGELPVWQAYADALGNLDAAARLNIFTQEHAQLATIASAHGLVYKPCGAGGGDIGIAVGNDPAAVAAFKEAVRAKDFVPLDLEIATDGVRFSGQEP